MQRQFEKSINACFSPGSSKRSDRNNPFCETAGKIYSYNTRKELIALSYDFARYIKENSDVKYVKNIDENLVEKYLECKAKEGCNQNTIKQYFSRIKKIEVLVSNYYRTSVNFTKNVKCPEGNKDKIRTAVMTENEYNRLIECKSNSKALIALKLAWNFGLRVSELEKLRVSDIKKEGIYIVDSKGGKTRVIPIQTQNQRDVLEEFKKNCAHNNSLGIKSDSINKFFSRQCKKLEITRFQKAKSSIHAIRKAYAEREYLSYRKSGLKHIEAWNIVSKNLGHGKRPELFEVYCPNLCGKTIE